MAADGEGIDLPGRRRELSELLAALASGSARTVLVGGDAGVGKTRLVEELSERARRRDVTVITGHAVDIEAAPPFWPVICAIRAAARADPHGDVRDLLSGWIDRLPPMDGADAAATRPAVRLLDMLHRLVVDLAALRRLLLVIEDLHWADRATRDLVAYLVANLGPEPVMIVTTYRGERRGSTPDFYVALAELRRHRNVSGLELQPLPRRVLADLVRGWAPGRPDLEPLVWGRSAGNAFIAEETVRAVLGGDARGLPASLREIVLSRVALLSPPARQVVRVVAAGVGPLPHRLLAEVLDQQPATMLGAVREAVAEGVVRTDEHGDGYQLRHGLMTDVVIADLLPGERVDLNHRYALALTRLGDPTTPGWAAQLAHHWHEAGQPRPALVATVAAARAAERMHAHTEACRHWLSAAELVPQARDDTVDVARRDCVDHAARAAELAGDHERAIELIDELLADQYTGCGMSSALLTARKASALAAAGRVHDAREAYRAAAASLPDSGRDAERARVLSGYGAALLHAMDFAAARATALEALSLARQAGARTVEARVLAVLGFSLAYLEDVSAGSAAIAEAIAVAERTGEPEAVGEAHLRRAELLAGPLNELVEGIERARESLEQVRSLGLSRTAGVALLTYAANALFRLGRWDEAGGAVAEAWALAPTGGAALEVRLARSRLDLALGRLDAAADDLEAVTLLARSTAGPRHTIPLLVLRAALELWRHRPEVALQHVEEGLTVAESGVDDIWSVAPLIWHGTRAWADVVARGLPAPAPPRTERLGRHCAELARRGTRTVPAVRGVVETFSLMCAAESARARDEPDPAAWEQLTALWDRHSQPYPAAYARFRFAEALLSRRSRTAAAGDALRRAARTARRLGAQPLLTEVADLARRARIPLDEPAAQEGAVPAAEAVRQSVVDALTPRELEVLVELANGLTNREIGDRLYISQKTVGIHVSRIFAKIGVHSRVQASAVLYRSRADPG
ncbi:helix-turn-helix transcriptional regulator [Pseudonocardia sp.]|uniref:helix-turn-helix transcriptional regulator n=1 Tax=Pseudonocardia sp. TaxID=60912 RepID=UPI003D100968